MRLLIFGATGGTGRELVRQALEQGHAVTAFTRDPAAIDEREGVRALAGDVLDAVAVERAIPGHDAVLCSLGRPAASPGTVRSHGTRNIIRAMQAAGPARLICQSTIGIGETRAQLPPLYRRVLVPTLLRRTFAEHRRQEELVRASQLDWTIVRAAALSDGARTGRYRHGVATGGRPIEFKISRADVADFTLGLLGGSDYLRQAPMISY